MLASPNGDLVESCMDYFYGPKTTKNRVLLLETLDSGQCHDVLAEHFTTKDSVPLIVLKANKIAELEQARSELLALPRGTLVLISVRLDHRFVESVRPGRLWHGYNQSTFQVVDNAEKIIEAYARRTQQQSHSRPNSSPELRELVELQSQKLAQLAQEIEKLKDQLAEQAVKNATIKMELEGELRLHRLEIGKLKEFTSKEFKKRKLE